MSQFVEWLVEGVALRVRLGASAMLPALVKKLLLTVFLATIVAPQTTSTLQRLSPWCTQVALTCAHYIDCAEVYMLHYIKMFLMTAQDSWVRTPDSGVRKQDQAQAVRQRGSVERP